MRNGLSPQGITAVDFLGVGDALGTILVIALGPVGNWNVYKLSLFKNF